VNVFWPVPWTGDVSPLSGALMLETNKNLVLGHLIKNVDVYRRHWVFWILLDFILIFHEVCFEKMFPFHLFIVRK